MEAAQRRTVRPNHCPEGDAMSTTAVAVVHVRLETTKAFAEVTWVLGRRLYSSPAERQ